MGGGHAGLLGLLARVWEGSGGLVLCCCWHLYGRAQSLAQDSDRRCVLSASAVTTNKPVALLQFLHKKKLKGETLSEEQ